jgi:hypothetical protein
MDYQIISSNKTTGQIQVAYKDNVGAIVATYSIDVPIVDGKFITGDQLHQEIIHRAPTWAITRKMDVENASNFDEIETLVQKIDPPKSTENQLKSMDMLRKIQFEKEVVDVLVQHGLMSINPTIIEVTKL